MKNDLALAALRLSGLFLAVGHGWGKVAALASGDADGFIQGVASLGFPAPGLFAWAAALGEFAGGLLVFAGLGTRYAAALAGFTMFVAAFLRHKAHLHLLVKLGLMQAGEETLRGWGNPELAVIYLLVMISLVLTGPGRFALDRYIEIRPKGGR
jgi:putative oxidoreductase